MTAPHFRYNGPRPTRVSVGQPVMEFPFLAVSWLQEKNVCLKKQGSGGQEEADKAGRP